MALVLVLLSMSHAGAEQVGSELAPALAPPSAFEMRESVKVELNGDRHLDASGIEVTAENGVVVLSGRVPLTSWKERASRVAGVVHGVRAVVNQIKVVPVSRPDRVVAEGVRKALRDTQALARFRLTVRVRRGVVELSGAISSWEQQQLAEKVARHVPGVRFCLNQLTWSTAIRRTSAIVAGDVQSRLHWDPLVQHDPIRVSVQGGRVVLVGITGGPAERRRAIALSWVKGVVAVDATALVIDSVARPSPNLRVRFPNDLEIADTIQTLARYWPSVPISALKISVSGGIVNVSGNVATLAEEQAVETMVRSAVGVVGAKVELRGPWWRPPPRLPPPPPRNRPKRVPRARKN